MSRILRKFLNQFTDKLRFVSIKTVFFIIIILGTIYTLGWYYIAQQTGDRIIYYIDAMRRLKINLSIEDYQNKGFPDHFSTFIEKITYKNTYNTFGWRTNGLMIYPPFLDSSFLIVDASNDHFFSYRHADQKDINKIAIRNKTCKIYIDFNNNIPKIFQIMAKDGVIQFFKNKQTHAYDKANFSMKSSNVLIGDRLEDILEMNLFIKNIEPTSQWKQILEDNFLYFKTKIYLRHPSYFYEIPNFQRYINRNYDPPEFIIQNMELMHRLSLIKVKGLLSFNTKMMLEGSLILTISDYQKILKFLTKKGVITKETAKNFRFMLSFLSSTKTLVKNDGSVDINLKVKNNIIYNDNIPLFKISL